MPYHFVIVNSESFTIAYSPFTSLISPLRTIRYITINSAIVYYLVTEIEKCCGENAAFPFFENYIPVSCIAQ